MNVETGQLDIHLRCSDDPNVGDDYLTIMPDGSYLLPGGMSLRQAADAAAITIVSHMKANCRSLADRGAALGDMFGRMDEEAQRQALATLIRVGLDVSRPDHPRSLAGHRRST